MGVELRFLVFVDYLSFVGWCLKENDAVDNTENNVNNVDDVDWVTKQVAQLNLSKLVTSR